MNELNVRAKNFFEFRKLLKLAYQMGYHFSQYYSPFNLWFWHNCGGLSFNNFESGNYEMLWLDCEMEDEISFKEFLLMIHGKI